MLSTRDDAVAQLHANLQWIADASGASALLFWEAAQYLLFLPEEAQAGSGARVRMNLTQVAQQADRARQFYLNAKAMDPPQVPQVIPRQFSFEHFSK